jgi:hypothetical protein
LFCCCCWCYCWCCCCCCCGGVGAVAVVLTSPNIMYANRRGLCWGFQHTPKKQPLWRTIGDYVCIYLHLSAVICIYLCLQGLSKKKKKNTLLEYGLWLTVLYCIFGSLSPNFLSWCRCFATP